MISKMRILKANFSILGMGIFFLLAGCNEKSVPVKIDRFEKALFGNPNPPTQVFFSNLAKQYGLFYHSYAVDVLNISTEEDSLNFAPSLTDFMRYPSIRQLYREVDSVFPDLSETEAELGKAMYQYHQYFPQWVQPKFVSFISEFGYANITYDSLIGIGLDMYLGNRYPLYPALEFPDFMIAKLRKEYMVPNAIRAIAIGKFESQLHDKRFVAMMLFEGKVKYFMKKLMPEIQDSILFGYTPAQLKWCKENEQMIWTHFIEKKFLYSSNIGEYMRYFNDGPFTIATGVPQESAPAIAVYIGYSVITKYMDENPKVSLSELMQNSGWDQLLQKSRYRP